MAPAGSGQTSLHVQAWEPPVSPSSFPERSSTSNQADLERCREMSCQAPCWALNNEGAAERNGTGVGFAVTLGSQPCHSQTPDLELFPSIKGRFIKPMGRWWRGKSAMTLWKCLTQSGFSIYFYFFPSLLRLTHLVLTRVLPSKEELVNRVWSDLFVSPSMLFLGMEFSLLSNKETAMPRMNGLSAFPSLSADPGQSSLFPVESSLCQPKAFNITFISQIKNLKPRKDNDVQKANFQILAKDLEIFQNTRCLGALGAHSLEFLIDSLKVCYSPDTVCTFKEFRPCGRSPQARSPKWQVLPHG